MYAAALLSLSLPFVAAQFERAAPADAIAPVGCFANTDADLVNLDGVADQRIAFVGAQWWIPRLDENGDARWSIGESIELLDTATNNPLAAPVRETFAAVAVAVPASASPGDRYQLVVGGQTVTDLTVAVGETMATTGQLDAIEVVQGGPQHCEVFCAVDGLTVPARPRLTFTQTGGPFVLDAFAVDEGASPLADTAPHRADSTWLDAVPEATVVEIDLDDIGWDGSVDVYVSLRDPSTLALIQSEFLAVAPLGSLPADTSGVSPCESGTGTQPIGCPLFGGPSIALLFLPVLGARLRRLRKRSSRS